MKGGGGSVNTDWGSALGPDAHSPSPSPLSQRCCYLPSFLPSCLVQCQLSLQVRLGLRVDVEVGVGTGDDSGENGPQHLHRDDREGRKQQQVVTMGNSSRWLQWGNSSRWLQWAQSCSCCEHTDPSNVWIYGSAGLLAYNSPPGLLTLTLASPAAQPDLSIYCFTCSSNGFSIIVTFKSCRTGVPLALSLRHRVEAMGGSRGGQCKLGW